MTGVVLTEAERDLVITSATAPDDDCAHNVAPLIAAVEAILTARLAAVEHRLTEDFADRVEWGDGTSFIATKDAVRLLWVDSAALADPTPDRASVAGGGES